MSIFCSSEISQHAPPSSALDSEDSATLVAEIASFPCSLLQEGSSVEVGVF